MDSQSFCLRWDGFETSQCSVFDELRRAGELVDVTLCCDGGSVRAHRTVLSAGSPYFRELFRVRAGDQWAQLVNGYVWVYVQEGVERLVCLLSRVGRGWQKPFFFCHRFLPV